MARVVDRRDQRERINAVAEFLLQTRALNTEGFSHLPADAERYLLEAERCLDRFDDALAKIDHGGGIGGRYRCVLIDQRVAPVAPTGRDYERGIGKRVPLPASTHRGPVASGPDPLTPASEDTEK